ncbi:MAG: hypothetical protein AAGI88_21910 [Pseudomonadota bacterium]
MTYKSDELKVSKKTVVFFDICSSTALLEDLLRSENLVRWRNLLIQLKVFLRKRGKRIECQPYKFQGDGWVLLFPRETSAGTLFEFLRDLTREYCITYKNNIEPVLDGDVPTAPGLTFGIDCGDLIEVKMNQTWEYIGRPLNVAARLESAVGSGDEKDRKENKGLILNSAYQKLMENGPSGLKTTVVNRTLKHVNANNRLRCRLIDFAN